MLEQLKERVCKLNRALPAEGLVTMTSGNVSGRDPGTGLVVIKPSGVGFDALQPDRMCVLRADGQVIEGDLKPSVDSATHLYVYRRRPDVHGIVHTHSNYATAFAALGRPIPVCLTAMADEFGGPVPVGGYAAIGEEEIGMEIVRSIGRSPAILMQNHGVFTVGPTPEKAFKAAVMCEDIAKTMFLAYSLGQPIELPPAEVERAYRRYQEKYGQ